MLKLFLRACAVVVLFCVLLAAWLFRGAFTSLQASPYTLPQPRYSTWQDVLAHPAPITVTTLQTGTIDMDACLNLDPDSPKLASCDHRPRQLIALVHWIHHEQLGDFLIDTGFDDSFATHPPYGSYTELMKFFNWTNDVKNGQLPGTDVGRQLATRGVHPKAVFFTHFHPDHTAGLRSLPNDIEYVFGSNEASFLARAAVAADFAGKKNLRTIDFANAPIMAPLGHAVDLLGDGSFWAISAPGHTDDDMAFLVNAAQPVLLTGDASHFAWAFANGVAPRGWNSAGTARAYVSLDQLRSFAHQFPQARIVYGHQLSDGQ
jgi:N-acyl homoserine lactone hydrolase